MLKRFYVANLHWKEASPVHGIICSRNDTGLFSHHPLCMHHFSCNILALAANGPLFEIIVGFRVALLWLQQFQVLVFSVLSFVGLSTHISYIFLTVSDSHLINDKFISHIKDVSFRLKIFTVSHQLYNADIEISHLIYPSTIFLMILTDLIYLSCVP